MRDVAIVILHLIVTMVRMARPGGLRSVVAESVLVKHQLVRYRCENSKIRDRLPLGSNARSDRHPKQLIDKLQLSERITFAHPSGSPLPNHVDHLDSL